MNATHDCAHRRVLKCLMLLQSDNKIRDGIDREDIKAVLLGKNALWAL